MKTKPHMSAIIYDKKGNILSIGTNSFVKTHPMQARFAQKVGDHHKHFLHAEISAITRCKQIDRAHKMIVFRYTADGKPALAKPCVICQAAIAMTTPIKQIEWTV